MSTVFKALAMSLFLGVIFLAACEKVTPEQRAARAAQEQERAYKMDYQVVELFTKDGCTVYKFRDNGNRHYFTNCTGSVVSDKTTGGKHPTHYDEEIPTAVN